MCGRYTLAAPADELVEVFEVPELSFQLVPRYNLAPGQDAPVVGEDRHGRRMGLLRWGFLPAAPGSASRIFVNARAESADRTPAFRDAFAHRRILVPADGFYEWRAEGGGKVPYWFHPAEGGLLSFAAVWERHEREGEGAHDGFAILTVVANDDVRPVHERMPLIVPASERATWLSRRTARHVLQRIVTPAPPGTLASRRVSTRVNATANDDEGLLDPV
jgi:putative SOS response-associated peptidase YedK